MQKKITVIVPVYKVEDYLDRCVSSIVGQTYAKLEIILVDDGSPDRCPVICDDWADKDKRIRVIHKKNGGLSDARNAGIEAATGDYLLFVDSDDYIEPTMCEKLLLAAEGNQADIAICSFYWEHPERKEVQAMPCSSGMVIPRDLILEKCFLGGSVAMVVAWNKLYRRELFFTSERIRYPVGRLHEDEFTSYRLLYEAHRTVLLADPFYHYIQRGSGITANYNERNLFDTMACAHEYLEWADRYASEKRPLMEYAAMNICRTLIRRCETSPNLKHCRSKVQTEASAIARKINGYQCNPYARWRDKVAYRILRWGQYGKLLRLMLSLRGH